MGRLAEPVEVAKACLYLATDATYSTGQNIYVSGGDELDYGFKSQMGFFFQPWINVTGTSAFMNNPNYALSI